jgi:hypothetical protein
MDKPFSDKKLGEYAEKMCRTLVVLPDYLFFLDSRCPWRYNFLCCFIAGYQFVL